MLTVVNVVLRHHQAIVALEHSSHIISDFLGLSPFLSLSEACKHGSIPLLDWIWDSSCTRAADRKPLWTLTNFLRSDPHYKKHQFGKSLEAAASRGDVAMMEWLFAHFPGCEAPEAVAYGAKEKGYLRVLHCLLAHQSPPGSTGSDLIGTREGTVHISDITTFWSDTAIQKATENGELVEYLKEGLRLESCALEVAIKHALSLGDYQLAERLLPIGRCLLDYAAGCPRAEMIEWMLDCGYLRRDEALAASTLPGLARSGHLTLAQQVVLLHSPWSYDTEFWETHWASAIYEAGICGQISILRWLTENELGREKINELSKTSNLFAVAAQRRHRETLDYLYRQHLACDFDHAMDGAIEGGQASSVKWLLSNHSFTDRSISSLNAIHRSAEHGHLEVLKVFHELSSSAYEAEGSKRTRVGITDPWWAAAIDPMYLAATGGQLAVIEWLHTIRKQKCEADTMDIAAGNGHLEVVKWLHVNRTEGCTVRAMNWAARSGHLDVIQWLHSNRSEGCTSRAMYEAARFGHLETVKWLYENRQESHTPEAVDTAVRSGYLRIACWLQQRFPDYKIGHRLDCYKELVTVCGRWDAENALEVLLYLHSLANFVIPWWFLETLRRKLSHLSVCEMEDVLVHVKRWLEEHYLDDGKHSE